MHEKVFVFQGKKWTFSLFYFIKYHWKFRNLSKLLNNEKYVSLKSELLFVYFYSNFVTLWEILNWLISLLLITKVIQKFCWNKLKMISL